MEEQEMLNKIEFSDLYRFLTSIGLIFIASSMLIPWLFMKQELGLISELEYQHLIEPSKILIDNRIKLYLRVVKILPFLSGLLFLFGSILIRIGYKNWKKKQDTIDESDIIKLNILRTTSSLNEEEIQQKAESEVEEEIVEQKTEERENTGDTEPATQKVVNLEELKTNLLEIEKLFYNKLIEFNSFVYNVKANVKINDKYEADILLAPINRSKYPDIIIEIKYLQIKLSMDIVMKSFGNMIRMQSYIYNTTKKKPLMYLMLVYKNSIAEPKEITRFKQGIGEYLSQFKKSQFIYYVLSEEEAQNFPISNIIK